MALNILYCKRDDITFYIGETLQGNGFLYGEDRRVTCELNECCL